jgi:hypothetical protein
MKNKLLTIILLLFIGLTGLFTIDEEHSSNDISLVKEDLVNYKKKTLEERRLYSIERDQYEFDFQKNPITGQIPREEKIKELEVAIKSKRNRQQKTTSSTYISRGPSNYGGRTRAVVVDVSDNTGNTIIAGGVSGGVFKTTDGGTSWTKVSANDEIHNVTAIAQDPRPGNQNIWYYGTGEYAGNSAALSGSFYLGQGVWKSTDSGDTWTQIPETNSTFESFTFFDIINNLVVNPVNGDLYIAATGRVYRYNSSSLFAQVSEPFNGIGWTDVAITQDGRVFISIEGSASNNGVYMSATGIGPWTKIAQNGDPAFWSASERIVLASVPSNNNLLYALYDNGDSGNIEADLMRYNVQTDTWTDYSSKLPDEAGGNSPGNDPFAIQGGYDLSISVKPDDEDFVVIGGTNIYKIDDIVNDSEFVRIGGYANNSGYALYNEGGVDHHPDIHAIEFDPNNNNILYSGTDGGVHKTANITLGTIPWTNLNNDYQTFQYYHVNLDPLDGSDIVIGGAQDNGTTYGGMNIGLPDKTTMTAFASGDGTAVAYVRRNNVDSQLYYGFQRGLVRTNYPSFRSINPVPEPDPDTDSSLFVTYFYLDPDNTFAMYYAGNTTQAGYGTLYRTLDAENVTTAVNALNWTNLGNLPGGGNEWIRSMATTRGTYNASSSYLLIGSDSGGVYRLNDPHNATDLSGLTTITPTGATTSEGTIVSGVAIHPTNNDIVMAVYSNYGIKNIYLTTNATAMSPTWTLVEGSLNSHSIRSVAITEVGGETIYFVGTARGLYSSPDPVNIDWEIEGANNIGYAVISGLVYRPSDKKMVIGTHGNGMFETTVQGTLSNEDIIFDNSIVMYPNPTKDKLNFKGSNFNLDSNSGYEIFDISGKIINKGILNSKSLDVSYLSNGLYFIRLDVDGSVNSLKFIKN